MSDNKTKKKKNKSGAGRIIAVASSLSHEFLASVGGVDEVISDFTDEKFIDRLMESVSK